MAAMVEVALEGGALAAVAVAVAIRVALEAGTTVGVARAMLASTGAAASVAWEGVMVAPCTAIHNRRSQCRAYKAVLHRTIL